MSADNYRARMAELNVEIEKVQHEMSERRAKGKPTDALEKRLEELERGSMTSSSGSRHYGVPELASFPPDPWTSNRAQTVGSSESALKSRSEEKVSSAKKH